MRTVDTDVLRKKLARARLCKNVEPSPPPKEPPEEQSAGLKYLIDNIFTPLLHEEMVHTADLDFEKFDDDDIENLKDYYYDFFYNGSHDWELLKIIYDSCNKTPPLSTPVCFI